MDSIINKLTEIESAASAIVQHAEAEKSALDEKFDKKRMDFTSRKGKYTGVLPRHQAPKQGSTIPE